MASLMGSNPDPNSAGRIISVGGGKGGVGKSIVAANLAVALARTAPLVVMVDLDLGAANQHLLLGLGTHRPGVSALLDGTIQDIREALTPTAIPGLHVLAGSGAVLGAANIAFAQKRRLIRKLRQLNAVVVLDVGAGVGFNTLDFFLLGDQKLVVTTPQVTAIHDAYSFLKGALLRAVDQSTTREIEAAILEPALASTEGVRVTDMFARLREQRPELGDRIASLRAGFGGRLIGNFVTRRADVGVFWSVTRMMREYLGIDVPVIGWLPADSTVADSVNERRPFVLGPPVEAVRSIHAIADTLMMELVATDLEVDIEVVEEDVPVHVEPPVTVSLAEMANRTPNVPPAPRAPRDLPGITPSIRQR